MASKTLASSAVGLPPLFRSGLKHTVLFLASVALVGGHLCLTARPIHAQATGSIEVLEPEEWRGAGGRGIVARARRSLRIVGFATHPSGIREVLLNGQKAALSVERSGETRFTGYVRVDSDTREVEVTANPVTGRFFSRRYNLEALPADQSYDTPDEAWSESVGGFSGERWAVVIGVSDYSDPQVPSLQYADDDAQAFYDFLLSERAGLGGFAPDHVLLLINENATTRNLRSALFSFLRNATENDIVIIYIAGHGTPDPERLDEHFLLAFDTDVQDLPATALRMNEVLDAVRRAYFRHLVVIVDACHSAGVGGQVMARDLALNQINRVFLERLEGSIGGYVSFTASEVNQLSREDSRWGGGHGVFTHFLLEGLGGAADDDGDGIVTLGEVAEYTRDRVTRETRSAQIPTLSQTAFDRYLPMAVVPVEPLLPPVLPEVTAPTPSFRPAERPAPLLVETLQPAHALPEIQLDSTEAQRPVEETPEEAPLPDSASAAETTSPAAEVDLISPAGAFAQSLFIPGSGQFRTGRGFRGFLVLAGSAGAVAYAVLATEVTKECREATVGGECLSGRFRTTTTERPLLIPGIAAAGALTFIGALDALFGARKVNAERLRQAGIETAGGATLFLLPKEPMRSSRPGDVRLLELRFR